MCGLRGLWSSECCCSAWASAPGSLTSAARRRLSSLLLCSQCLGLLQQGLLLMGSRATAAELSSTHRLQPAGHSQQLPQEHSMILQKETLSLWECGVEALLHALCCFQVSKTANEHTCTCIAYIMTMGGCSTQVHEGIAMMHVVHAGAIQAHTVFIRPEHHAQASSA